MHDSVDKTSDRTSSRNRTIVLPNVNNIFDCLRKESRKREEVNNEWLSILDLFSILFLNRLGGQILKNNQQNSCCFCPMLIDLTDNLMQIFFSVLKHDTITKKKHTFF